MARFSISFQNHLTCRLVNSWPAIMILKIRNQEEFVLTAANLKQILWLYVTLWLVVGKKYVETYMIIWIRNKMNMNKKYDETYILYD